MHTRLSILQRGFTRTVHKNFSFNACKHAIKFTPIVSRSFTKDSNVLTTEPVTSAGDYTSTPDWVSALTPSQVVDELNRFIVGQTEAKKAVAIALRNRWRRHRLSDELKEEVLPKNILMIGPTGVGKTEIARRLAKLCQAPFIKVEATKFTEVGFHGRDVDQIIRDLMDIGITHTKTKLKEKYKDEAAKRVEEIILDHLVGKADPAGRETYRGLLRNKELEEREIEVELPEKQAKPAIGGHINENIMQFQEMIQSMMSRSSRVSLRKVKIKNARSTLEDAELDKMLNNDQVVKEAIRAVEEDGIVFIDEIDKICTGAKDYGHDASAEGVQRDLLPLIEGTVINTKYGNIKTDHILFIASGAFHSVKPADMLAELQGRLPIRVELKGLTEEDLVRILKEPEHNILKQNIELLKTEDVDLYFSEESIKELASVGAEINSTIENIGARRLLTVVEKVLEDISFNAPNLKGQRVEITKQLIREKVGDLLKKADLSKFVL
jgi:ATP-dependent HslUV protease ATP-binding subunit HslU